MFLDNIVDESSQSSIENMDALVEHLLVSELSVMPQDKREAIMESAEFEALEEAGVVSKRSVMHLNREDDARRRTMVACIQKAREAKDPLYTRLRKAIKMKKDAQTAIYKKYNNKVRKSVVMAQKKLIKINPQVFTHLNVR